MSVHFVHNMIKDKIPQEPTDFTRKFPQYLTFKILQHLDPRTLAQASLVSSCSKELPVVTCSKEL